MAEIQRAPAVNLPAMPLEGHYQRVNTPLRRLTKRERNVAAIVLAITVVAILVLMLAPASSSTSNAAAGPGCIYAVVAGRTGGEPVSSCGAEAIELCRRALGSEGPWSEAVSGACLSAGVKP
jgi:hypothetical protein